MAILNPPIKTHFGKGSMRSHPAESLAIMRLGLHLADTVVARCLILFFLGSLTRLPIADAAPPLVCPAAMALS